MGRRIVSVGQNGVTYDGKINDNFADTYRKIYNVIEYGAVGDGVTTNVNQVAFQTAINACVAAGGGDVFVPNGTYIFNEALVNTGSDGIVYHSQIYFPYRAYFQTLKNVSVRLIGESFQMYQRVEDGAEDKIGVVLKSTLDGTGQNPSVISCIDQNGVLSYLQVELINIVVAVEAFKDTTGISMNGINMACCDHGYVNNVSVRCADSMQNTKEPVNPVFALAIGYLNNDFLRIGFYECSYGFTYGLIIGEGVVADQIMSLGNKKGVLVLNNYHPPLINWICVNWCAYMIAAQTETMFGLAPTVALGRIKINMLTFESSLAPDWLAEVDSIYDPNNILVGNMDYNLVAGGCPYLMTNSHGGVNLLKRAIWYRGSAYHWSTANRPQVRGNIGYNTTTDKMEWFDGSVWHDV